MNASEHFMKPSPIERLMNKTIGVLARWGVGPAYLHLLQVRGRTSGKVYVTPVNLFRFSGRTYLVGGRGHTAWSKNTAAAGEVTLQRGSARRRYRAAAIPDAQKPEILKGYLQEYRSTVQKFFSVSADAPTAAFQEIAGRHPVFELTPLA